MLKLTDILQSEKGAYVWLFTRESDKLKTPKQALRRVHSYLQQPKHLGTLLDCTSVVLVNCRDHESEVALIININ